MSASLPPQQQIPSMGAPQQRTPNTLLNNHSSEVHLKQVIPNQKRRMAKSATGQRRRIRATSKPKQPEQQVAHDSDDEAWKAQNN